MRLLHIADVHLDTPFAGRSDALRRRLRDASRQAFRRAVDTALSERVDVVLVAGDLFDGERLSFRTERFLLEELERLGGARIPVVYATGNHDPGRDAYRSRPLAWPDHVVVVGEPTPRRVAVVDRRDRRCGWITAAGHGSRRETADLAAAFPAPHGDLPEVALLHTQVMESRDAAAHDPYAPSNLLHLVAAGFDYWALGHVHLRQALSDAPPVHYPGNTQGRTHRESGAKGGLLVDLADPRAPSVEFRAFAPVRFETVEVDGLEGAASLEALVRAVRRRWDRALLELGAESGTDWLVRFVLRGACPLWADLADPEERQALAVELRTVLRLLDVEVRTEALHPAVEVEEHLRREDVLGTALRLAAAVREGTDTLGSLQAEELAGLDHPDARDPNAYVRELLEGAESEIVVRLLTSQGREAR